MPAAPADPAADPSPRLAANLGDAPGPGRPLRARRAPLPIPRLSNADLAPTTVAQRTWTTYNVASLWIGLAVCIPTYMLAAGLVEGGMSWWQALATILLGNLIVLVPMVLIAHAGHALRHPVPGARPRLLRHDGRPRAGPPARPGRPAAGSASRPGSAARRSTPCWRPPGPAGEQVPGGLVDRLRRLLAEEHVSSWCAAAARSSGWRPGPRRSSSSPASRSSPGPPSRAGGLGPMLARPEPVPDDRRVPPLLRPLAHRHGRLLGHARPQHPRPLPLRARPAGPGPRPAPRPADDDDAVLLHRRRRDLRLRRDLRRGDLGPGRAAGPARQPAGDPDLALRPADRHPDHQRGGQRRGAGQRLRQPVARADQLRRPAAC